MFFGPGRIYTLHITITILILYFIFDSHPLHALLLTNIFTLICSELTIRCYFNRYLKNKTNGFEGFEIEDLRRSTESIAPL